MTTIDCPPTMNPYGHSSSRSDASSSHSSPTSSSMYSTASSMYSSASSGIQECFLSQAERLSGSEDDESKSSPTTSSSGHYSDGSWENKRQMKANGVPKASEPRRHHKKSKKSKKSKRKRASPDLEDDNFANVKRIKNEPCDDDFLKVAKRMKSEPNDDDFAMAKRIKNELYEEYAATALPKVSKKKRHNAEAGPEKRATEPSPNEHPEISSVMGTNVQKMMAAMGYKQGEGLGKHSQGRVAPIVASKQKGRRGLGMVVQSIDLSSIHYDPTQEVIELREKYTWLENRMNYDLSEFDSNLCMQVGSKKRTLEDEAHFCDPHILKNVLTCKSALDKLQGEEIRRARSRANPFEMIKKGPYLNRAAMKMANMDYVFDHMFTNPVDEFQHSLIGYSDLLYFADVCAGPGGFSEYVLSKKRWEAKGFGFTLKGDNDFKLTDFTAGPCESFEPFYGHHGDGDVYKTRNIVSFNQHVMENTDHTGVHFMMADGGFSVEGQENIQEILSKRIYLCQCLVALSIVRVNGHFVCKLFDLFTPFSVGLIYLMYSCFKKITIVKPNTSRPANSERYLVCKWKCDNTESIRDHMVKVNEAFNKYGETCDNDINEIVPLSIIKDDTDFYNYICASNNELGLRQINSLAKILKYAEDESLVEEKQQDLKKACLELWQVPNRTRREIAFEPDSVCRKFLNNDLSILREQTKNILNYQDLNQCLYTIHDYFAVVLGSYTKATFYLGVAHKRCYQYDRSSNKWVSTPHNMNLELSPNTLVYGEIVQEVIGESLAQRKLDTLHIIDGHTLGGTDISQLPYPERNRMCTLYAKALRRPSMNNVMPIRAKKIFELDGLKMAFKRMRDITMKNSRSKLVYCINSQPENNEFFVPHGLMFIKHTKAPYKRFISKTNYKYFWAPKKDAVFDRDRPKESVADFKESYRNSLFWHANEEENVPFNRQSYIDHLMPFIANNMFTKRDEK